MTWIAQVGHVMRKDLLQARWFLIVYLGVVMLATARALEWPATSNDAFDLSAVFVVVAGMFLVAFLVQADSPIRSDAFWASRPIHPAAMLAAKLLLALIVVVGAPLVGQLGALTTNHVPVAAMSLLASRSAWTYASWLLIAMVLAAMTSDLRGFTTVLVAIPVALGLVIVSSRFPSGSIGGGMSEPGRLATLMPVSFTVAGVGGGLVLLVALYRKRPLRRRMWVGAVAAVACLLLSIFVTPQSRAASLGSSSELSIPAVAFQVEVREDERTAPELTLRTEGIQLADRLVGLDSGVAILRLRDGTTLRVSVGRMALSRATLPTRAGIRWLGGYADARPTGAKVLRLNRSQREALRAGIAGATIEGQVTVLEPRIVATLPFRAGASLTREGRRVRIQTVNHTAEDSLATLSVSSIGSASRVFNSDWAFIWPFDTPRYALVNETRGEAMMVAQGGSGGSTDAIVLPGAWRVTTSAWLHRNAEYFDLAKNAAWFDESRLVIAEWVLRGRTAFRAEATLRQ